MCLSFDFNQVTILFIQTHTFVKLRNLWPRLPKIQCSARRAQIRSFFPISISTPKLVLNHSKTGSPKRPFRWHLPNLENYTLFFCSAISLWKYTSIDVWGLLPILLVQMVWFSLPIFPVIWGWSSNENLSLDFVVNSNFGAELNFICNKFHRNSPNGWKRGELTNDGCNYMKCLLKKSVRGMMIEKTTQKCHSPVCYQHF